MWPPTSWWWASAASRTPTGWRVPALELGDGVLCDAMGRTNVRRESWPWGTALPGSTTAAGTHRRVEHWTGALERPALAVAALLDADAAPRPAEPPYFWSDQYGVKLQFAGHCAGTTGWRSRPATS